MRKHEGCIGKNAESTNPGNGNPSQLPHISRVDGLNIRNIGNKFFNQQINSNIGCNLGNYSNYT